MGKKSLYHVMAQGTGKRPRSIDLHAFDNKTDALDVARQYSIEHPNHVVGVFYATRIKIFGRRPKRGRIIKG